MDANSGKEKEIWNSFRKGEPRALAIIFQKYYASLYNFAFTICHNEELVKDSIQELFGYLWEKRNTLAEVNSVRLYLITALRRTLLKAVNKQKIESEKNKTLNNEWPEEAFSAQDLIIFKEQDEQVKNKLKEALNQIPSRMREALYLKTYDNFSYQEISKIMNISPQVARNYVFQALQRLRKLLSKPL